MKIPGVKPIAKFILIAMAFAAVSAFGREIKIPGCVESFVYAPPATPGTLSDTIVAILPVPSVVTVYTAPITPYQKKVRFHPQLVAKIITDKNGNFVVNLNPGKYMLSTDPINAQFNGQSGIIYGGTAGFLLDVPGFTQSPNWDAEDKTLEFEVPNATLTFDPSGFHIG